MERQGVEKITQKKHIFDALIIGGGPAGSTTALLLAKAGWSVGLVEKKKFPRRKVCGEFMSATNLALLAELGIGDFYHHCSGPEIKRVGLFAANTLLSTKMPTENNLAQKWGRALGREHLDLAILNKATQMGITLWQPGTLINIEKKGEFFSCTLKLEKESIEVLAFLVIMANGSWEVTSNSYSINHKAADLFAFKAHFRKTNLPADLMPLIAFPGGYGGLVHSDYERVFSLLLYSTRCVRKGPKNVSSNAGRRGLFKLYSKQMFRS